MISRLCHLIILIFFSIIIQSCDDEWVFEVPIMPEFLVIDASSYDDWIYFSFELDEVVDISEPENSLNWDMAFKRNNIKTNGGLSGQGNVCAIVDDDQFWTNDLFEVAEQISSEACQSDELIEGNITFPYQGCYNNTTHIFTSCVKNPALDNWGWFEEGTYRFNINNYQLFLKRTDSYGLSNNSRLKMKPHNRS